MRVNALLIAILVLVPMHGAFGQKQPDKIRGYKIYETNVRVVNAAESGNTSKTGEADAWIRSGDPKFVDAGLSGVTFEIDAEIGSASHSGKVDFLTFHNFRINGIAVEIPEYDHSFTFNKDVPVQLPAPVGVFVSSSNVTITMFRELFSSKKEWAVTGTVYVFGDFKKRGFTFKRVIPVKIELSIKNPLNT